MPTSESLSPELDGRVPIANIFGQMLEFSGIPGGLAGYPLAPEARARSAPMGNSSEGVSSPLAAAFVNISAEVIEGALETLISALSIDSGIQTL